MADKTPRVALITGANKGIGFASAEALAKLGHTVIIGARDAKLGEAALAKLNATHPAHPAVFLHLDVTDHQSVTKAFETTKAQFSKIDVLINNAGIFIDSTPTSALPYDTLLKTFQVNFFGAVDVTTQYLPLLKASDAPRIVFVSSNLGSQALHAAGSMNQYPTYDFSKAALNSYCIHLAGELRNTAFKINAIHPGYVATDMTRHMGPVTVDQAAQLVLKYATLPADGVTGGFFDHKGTLPW